LLPLLERERLLSGNWKIQPAAGPYFKRAWCAVVDEVPADLDVVRYWNLAVTEKTEINDPDGTINVKLGRDRNGGFWLLDIMRGYPALASAASDTGLVTVPPEAEGIMRTMPTIASVGSLLLPSFGIEVVRLASWADWISLRAEPGGERALEYEKEQRKRRGDDAETTLFIDLRNIYLGLGGKPGISDDGPLYRFAQACVELIDQSIILPQAQTLRKALNRRKKPPSYVVVKQSR
jgi:hypothetical protein